MAETKAGSSLVLVPAMAWVRDGSALPKGGVLVLDDLLLADGVAETFRRLRLRAALLPYTRVAYQRLRHAYLATVMERLSSSMNGVVVLGSHSDDVDLFDFLEVGVVRLEDTELRRLGREVYGDPMMSYVEHVVMQHAVHDAVDRYFDLTSMHSLPLALIRAYPVRGELVDTITAGERSIMLHDAMTVYEAECDSMPVDFEGYDPYSTRLATEYEYLGAVLPVWREAVARMLGPAPGIQEIVRLPRFVIDLRVVDMLCIRADGNGMPVAATRGKSLVQFIQQKLVGSFSARELAGTWVGALLCNDELATGTLEHLGFSSIVDDLPINFASSSVTGDVGRDVVSEFMPMYSLIRGSAPVTWKGKRDSFDWPVVTDSTSHDGLVVTTALASRYANQVHDPLVLTEVARMLYRLESVGVDHSYICAISQHALLALSKGVDSETYDSFLTPVLPGYGYLLAYPDAVRPWVLDKLRAYPNFRDVGRASNGSFVTRINQVLRGDACRSMLYSGLVTKNPYDCYGPGQRVGLYPAGYCYLTLFRSQCHEHLCNRLGSYPTFAAVFNPVLSHMMIEDVMERVYVVRTALQKGFSDSRVPIGREVVHMTLDQRPFIAPVPAVKSHKVQLLRYFVWEVQHRKVDHHDVLVGAAVSGVIDAGAVAQCYGPSWFVAAIISWTIVGVVVVCFFGWLLKERCTRSRAGVRRR